MGTGTGDTGTTSTTGPTGAVVVKRRWMWWLTGAAVLVALAVWALPKMGQRSPREVMAEQLGVTDAGSLALNLPPLPLRYPGSILLPPDGLPIDLVAATDADLTRGPAFRFTAGHDGSVTASGSVASPVFEELLTSRSHLSLELEVPECRAIEMSWNRLGSRVGTSTAVQAIEAAATASSGTDDPIPAPLVIVRAWEGKLVYHVSHDSSYSAEAWTAFKQKVAAASDSDSTAKVKLDSGSQESGDLRIETTEAAVFAYETRRTPDLHVGNAPGPPVESTQAPHGGAAGSTKPDAPLARPAADGDRTIRWLMKIGPEHVPALDQTLRELGPQAAPAVLQAMQLPDPETRARAATLLRRLPPPAAARGLSSAALLASPDASLRAWSLSRADPSDGATLAAFTHALSDTDAAVRDLATQGLAALGSKAASSKEALRERLQDADAAVRLSATTALLAVDPHADVPLDTLRSGLASDNDGLRRASLETIGKLGTRAAVMLPDVERAAQAADPATRRLATETAKRVKPR